MVDIGKISSFQPDAKVWVYYPNSTLDSSKVDSIKSKLKQFSEGWNTHGTKVKNYIELIQPHNIILIIADSSTLPSGCSIDSQVAMIREVESITGIGYMDRTKFYYLNDNQFIISDIQNIKNEIEEHTMVFNPFFDDLKDWSENFLVLARNSKYKKMLGY